MGHLDVRGRAASPSDKDVPVQTGILDRHSDRTSVTGLSEAFECDISLRDLRRRCGSRPSGRTGWSAVSGRSTKVKLYYLCDNNDLTGYDKEQTTSFRSALRRRQLWLSRYKLQFWPPAAVQGREATPGWLSGPGEISDLPSTRARVGASARSRP